LYDNPNVPDGSVPGRAAVKLHVALKRPPNDLPGHGEMEIDDAMDPARLLVWVEPYEAGGAFIVLDGRLDAVSVRSVAEAIVTEIDRGHRHLIIDLDAVTSIDGAGVRSLAGTVAVLGNDPEAAVVLAGGGRRIQQELRRSGAERLFPIASGRWVALGTIREPSDPMSDGWRHASRLRSPSTVLGRAGTSHSHSRNP
jgi:anti-anti-sigma factor